MPNDQTNEETPMGRRFRAARLNPASVAEWFTLKTERRRKLLSLIWQAKFVRLVRSRHARRRSNKLDAEHDEDENEPVHQHNSRGFQTYSRRNPRSNEHNLRK